MRLDEIKIPEIYLKTPPTRWKLDACREYFGKFGHIDRRIVVDKNGVLRDGYVGYLVLKENGVSDCDVVVNSQKQVKHIGKYYLFAVHEGKPQRICVVYPEKAAWVFSDRAVRPCKYEERAAAGQSETYSAVCEAPAQKDLGGGRVFCACIGGRC